MILRCLPSLDVKHELFVRKVRSAPAWVRHTIDGKKIFKSLCFSAGRANSVVVLLIVHVNIVCNLYVT